MSALRRASRATLGLSIASGRNLLQRFRYDQSGSYLIMSGLLMPALAGFAALGTEVGHYLHMPSLTLSAQSCFPT
jgi:Flp pilus assembly protein TadG